MPYCPNCHTEYQPGFSTCSDCQVTLVEGKPLFCDYCSALVKESDVFCDSCGDLQELPEGKDRPECNTHHDVDAVAGCVICGKPICDDCAHFIDDVAYCEDDGHQRINQEYIVVYRTSTDYEAEMLRANLIGAGIDAVVFNQHDHVYFVNLGALAVVTVMVRKKDEERAVEIIKSILESEAEEHPDVEDGESQ
jgi:putative signal transducing protein/double zinc ribbon protein